MTKQPQANLYQQFLDDLHNESPRAAYALQSMQYKLMSQTGLDEKGALEVVSKIVAKSDDLIPTQPKKEQVKMIDYENLNDDEKEFVRIELDKIAEGVQQRRAQSAQKELNARYNAAMRKLFNRPGGRPGLHEIQAVREQFRAMGLTDWTVTHE